MFVLLHPSGVSEAFCVNTSASVCLCAYPHACMRVCVTAAEPKAVRGVFNMFNFELFDSCIIHRLAGG